MAALLTVEDVSARLGVAVQTIYQWRARKPHPYGPPAFKVGKYLRWTPEAVDAWIAEQAGTANVTPIRRTA